MKFTPKSATDWGSAFLTWFGMFGLVACFVVWAITKQHIVEPIFVTAFSGLLVAGQGAQALGELRSPPPPPIPPPPPAIEPEPQPEEV